MLLVLLLPLLLHIITIITAIVCHARQAMPGHCHATRCCWLDICRFILSVSERMRFVSSPWGRRRGVPAHQPVDSQSHCWALRGGRRFDRSRGKARAMPCAGASSHPSRHRHASALVHRRRRLTNAVAVTNISRPSPPPPGRHLLLPTPRRRRTWCVRDLWSAYRIIRENMLKGAGFPDECQREKRMPIPGPFTALRPTH